MLSPPVCSSRTRERQAARAREREHARAREIIYICMERYSIIRSAGCELLPNRACAGETGSTRGDRSSGRLGDVERIVGVQ